jgi:O-antigen ligase
MRLSAHNDLINVFVEFGLLGLIAFFLVYKELYLYLEPRYRSVITFYFIFVFFTNGILFHQSNILFVLYLKSNKKVNNVTAS